MKARSLVALLVLLPALGAGAGVADGGAASGPFAAVDGSSSGGYPLAGGGPSGIGIRFIDRGSFWVAMLLENTSSEPVTILGVETPEPAHSLVSEAGPGLVAPFTPCSGDRACPFPAPTPPPSTSPLTVAPGHDAAVKFDYRLVSCAAAPRSSTAGGDSVRITYRGASGATRTQTLPLTYAKLRLLRPAGEECLPRPFSHIGLVGSFTTSPGHKPMPGSDGDTCSETVAHALAFESRTFLDRDGVMWRLRITLPHFAGLGAYGRASHSLGPARVVATGGFGLHGWTVFGDDHGSVTVTSDAAGTAGGRFTAVFSGHRRFFRGYGAWRCRLR